MVEAKYILYLTPTMSDNIILINLCFELLIGTLELCSHHEYKNEILD